VDVVWDAVGLAMESSRLMGFRSRLLVVGFTGWNAQGGLDKRAGLPEFAVKHSWPLIHSRWLHSHNDLRHQVNRLLVKHCSLIGVYLYNWADFAPAEEVSSNAPSRLRPVGRRKLQAKHVLPAGVLG